MFEVMKGAQGRECIVVGCGPRENSQMVATNKKQNHHYGIGHARST